MKSYFDQLKACLTDNPPNVGSSDSVLAFLYEAYAQMNPMDSTQIKADFDALYQAMNGMELQEMDRILDPVCTLCRDQEQAGFIAGIQIGNYLAQELIAEQSPL